MPRQALTNKRYSTDAIYQFIVDYKREHIGASPSYGEITRAMGIKSTSAVFYHLRKLRQRGLVTGVGVRRISLAGEQWSIQLPSNAPLKIDGLNESKKLSSVVREAIAAALAEKDSALAGLEIVIEDWKTDSTQ